MADNRTPAQKADAHRMELARRFLRDHKPQNCTDITEIEGWQREVKGLLFAGSLTDSMRARLKLFAQDIDARHEELKLERYKGVYAAECAAERAKVLGAENADALLLSALIVAADQAPEGNGFLYFKKWTMPDGSAWYKVGITNDPARRDAEQNVLPVAAETLACIDLGGMERARNMEGAIHATLDSQRITDANNRELFHLTDPQVAAVLAVFRHIKGESVVVIQKDVAAQVLAEVRDPRISEDGGAAARLRAMELLTASGLSVASAGLMLAAWLAGEPDAEERLLDQMEAGVKILSDQ